MDILLNSVEIVDQRSPYHGKRRNIHLKNGVIKEVSTKKLKAQKIIDAKGMKLSIGWFDVGANLADPGMEYKEDLRTGHEAALHGGFTGIAVLPNTLPVVQSKNEISYLINSNSDRITRIYPLGAVTIDTKGNEITEMIDLHHSGAVAFTDGIRPLWHTDVMLKSLQYLHKFDGLLINRPEDTMLTSFGSMHEGIQSTTLGLKGMPRIAEELMIARDLQLLEYTGGRLHFSNISSEGSVDLIRKAKKRGLQVTCDVIAHQIVFSDEALEGFDTNYKVNPPFREKKDNSALKKGLKDGTIDLIVSGHRPQDEESKKIEFDHAEFGITGLQTFFHLINNFYEDYDLGELVKKFTVSPRELLRIQVPEIKEGVEANLTLFDPNRKWDFNEASNQSKSRNSPFLGKELTGKVTGVFNNGKAFLDTDLND